MPSSRESAFRAIVAVERDRAVRIDEGLKADELTPVERDLALELARGVERKRRLLDLVINELADRQPPRDPYLRSALRLGAYQVLFLTRIPSHAAVNETVKLVRHGRGMVNAVLRRLISLVQQRPPDPAQARREIELPEGRTLALERDVLPDMAESPAEATAILHGLPSFLVERWVTTHGLPVATQIARASSHKPCVSLRANRLRCTAEELAFQLEKEGVETQPSEHPRMLRWTGGASPFSTQAMNDGLFLAQDPTALRAVDALEPREGEVLLDLCAAPGGKATALAEAVAPTGCVHAFDPHPGRREKIQENAIRLGLEKVLSIHGDLATLPLGDGALADVPCSNTGVLSRRVEVRRRISQAAIEGLARKQRGILEDTMARVRPGGRVVYSTCSLEFEENEDVVAASAGRLIRDELTLPDPPHHDGGYFAVLQVSGGSAV